MYRHFFKYPVLALSVLLASGTAARGQESVYGILHIDKSRTEKVSPVRYGLHYEEIGMMGEGALHAELVRNRSFEEANPPEGLSVRNGLYENIPAPKAPAHEVFECDPLAGWTTLPLSWSPIYISRTQEYGMNEKNRWSMSVHVTPEIKDCPEAMIVNRGYFGMDLRPG